MYLANKVQNIQAAADTLLECAGLTQDEIRPVAEAMEQGGRLAAKAAVTDAILDKCRPIAGTPDEVVIPLQYAVALNTRRSPGEGTAVTSRRPPCRTEYFESSVFASYNDTKPPTAMTVTKLFRQSEPEMIMVWVPIVVLRMQITD